MTQINADRENQISAFPASVLTTSLPLNLGLSGIPSGMRCLRDPGSGGRCGLGLSSVVDFHRFNLFAAAVFEKLEGVMVLVGNLDQLANLGLHARHRLIFRVVGQGL